MCEVRVAHRPEKADEETLRSRSFVFIALGLYAAQAFSENTPLYMFENGLIALNVPLTPSRAGSCSTRTMHPYYLERVRALLKTLGVTNPLLNPYGLKTKGECVMECRDRSLLAQLVNRSVSCSHASRKQDWIRKNAANCGYCVPCLFRRASLNIIGIDDGQQYGLDVLVEELTIDDPRESANDLRAVTDFLRGTLTPAAIQRKVLATATFPDIEAHALMASRGSAELKLWLEAAVPKSKPSLISEHA